ncbi:MAG: hypothetical protein NZ700_02950 [Gemmataceae bacterium]|nr:hypothetical protein [Gemmataceae bacterium]MDW8266705.1 hypothetical protein [Gemmataceae bacterium]
MRWLVLAVVGTLVAGVLGWAEAAGEPLPPEQLQKLAHVIVVGDIKEVYSTEESDGRGLVAIRYAFSVAVDSVEKDKSLEKVKPKPVKAGDLLFVRSFAIRRAPDGWSGDAGPGAPQPGSRVKLFLRRQGGAFEVLSPNGVEWLTGEPALVPVPSDDWQVEFMEHWWLAAVGGAVGGVLGFLFGWSTHRMLVPD